MTQAFNLSQLANNLNSSGQLDATDGLTGLVPLANGGTGATNTVNTVVAGSGISVSTSGTQVTVSASGSGTVTSVATGNGLQGGTITTSGTLSVACPTYNSVGSYVYGLYIRGSDLASGATVAAGAGGGRVSSGAFGSDGSSVNILGVNNLSGTWRNMSASFNTETQNLGVFCRVS